MLDNNPFSESGDIRSLQTGLDFDDGTGLRVVSAKFLDEQRFDWSLFDDYESLRVLTYSARLMLQQRLCSMLILVLNVCMHGVLMMSSKVLKFIKNVTAVCT